MVSRAFPEIVIFTHTVYFFNQMATSKRVSDKNTFANNVLAKSDTLFGMGSKAVTSLLHYNVIVMQTHIHVGLSTIFVYFMVCRH